MGLGLRKVTEPKEGPAEIKTDPTVVLSKRKIF